MRIIETPAYTFDELSDPAKERARNWYRQQIESDEIGDPVIEDAIRIGEILGITVKTRPVRLLGGGTRANPVVYWDLGRGGGVGFAGRYAWRSGMLAQLQREAPISWTDQDGVTHTNEQNARLRNLAIELQQLQKRYFYSLEAQIETASRSGTDMCVVVTSDRGNVRIDDQDALATILRTFASWIYQGLQENERYLYSAESVDEMIRANEYEFTAEGKRV